MLPHDHSAHLGSVVWQFLHLDQTTRSMGLTEQGSLSIFEKHLASRASVSLSLLVSTFAFLTSGLLSRVPQISLTVSPPAAEYINETVMERMKNIRALAASS